MKAKKNNMQTLSQFQDKHYAFDEFSSRALPASMKNNIKTIMTNDRS
jgi:hypothetical protein